MELKFAYEAFPLTVALAPQGTLYPFVNVKCKAI